MISKDDLKYIKENKGDDVGFIFYSGDVLQDVAMMNDKMKGVYLSILALHMKNISFSYDELMMLSDSLSDVEKKSLVNKLSEIDGEYFINWVLVAIYKRRKYAENRAENRIKGYLKNKEKEESTKVDENNISLSYDNHMENEIEIENKDEKETEVKEKKQILNFHFDTENFKTQWQLWKVYRKKKHKFTYFDDESEQKALTELFNLSNKDEKTAMLIIRQSIDNGWKGFFELKQETKPKVEFIEARLKK